MTKPTKGNARAEKSTSALIVLGYDDQQKPRGARFTDANPNLVAKAAELMDLNLYEAANGDLAVLAKKLPVGRLYSTGKGFVPNIRGKVCTARSSPRSQAHQKQPAAKTTTCRPWRLDCQKRGTSLAPATSSSHKRATTTAGGKRSASSAMATC
jgi:hypothetical protein